MIISSIGLSDSVQGIIAAAAETEDKENKFMHFECLEEYLESEASRQSNAVFICSNSCCSLRRHFRKIRSQNANVKIIVVAGEYNFIGLAFELNAFQYLRKRNVKTKSVLQELSRVRRETEASSRYFFYSKKGIQMKILLCDIVYVEAKNRYIYINSADGICINFKGKANDAFSLFPTDCFIRAHKSFLINCRYISGFSGNRIYLDNSRYELPVSRAYKDAVISECSKLSQSSL
mgnify:CR=1 FL=1